MENEPRNLNRFLDEARADRESLRLVAQTLGGTALEGSRDKGESKIVSTNSVQSALKKLLSNWPVLIELRLNGFPD